MFLISPKLSLFVIIFIPLCGFVISVVGKSLRRKSLKVQKEQGQFISLVDETLSGMKILKIFNAENKFLEKFTNSTKRFYQFSNSVLNRKNLASPLSEFLGISSIDVGSRQFNRSINKSIQSVDINSNTFACLNATTSSINWTRYTTTLKYRSSVSYIIWYYYSLKTSHQWTTRFFKPS